MANEATLVTQTSIPINFTVADGVTIEKGTVLKMADPMTASASSALRDTFAGIAAAEKIASDGVTKLAVYRRGIFKMYLSGSATIGDPLITSETANHVYSALGSAYVSGSRILGCALETGTSGETILVEVNPVAIGS